MRKFGAFSAVAAAAALMAPAAFAAMPHATVNGHRLNDHHLLMVGQLPRTSMKAHTTQSAAPRPP